VSFSAGRSSSRTSSATGRRVERHAWNLLPSGLALDLTTSQFEDGGEYEEPVPGEPIMVNRAGYELFARRVRESLSLDD
jgi:hypothetical protein